MWIALSFLSLIDLIDSGKIAPSTFLHKQLDMTEEFVAIDFRGKIWEDFEGRDSVKTLELAGLQGVESGRSERP